MIKGRSISLRPVTKDDLEWLRYRVNDADYNTPFHNFGLVGAKAFEAGFNQNGLLSPQEGVLIAIDLSGTIVGSLDYHKVAYGPNPASQVYHIGFSVAPQHRGRGHATDGVSLITDYLLANYPVARVEAATDAAHAEAQRVLEKAGFQYEGTLRKAQWRQSCWWDLTLYSKIRSL